MSIQFERPTMGLDKEQELDYLRAENERKGLLLEYVAMMCDVELPEDEGVYGDE